MENAEPFLWSMFEGQLAATNKNPTEQTLSTLHGKKERKRNEGRWFSQQENTNQNEDCKSNILSVLKAKVRGSACCNSLSVLSHTSGMTRFLV